MFPFPKGQEKFRFLASSTWEIKANALGPCSASKAWLSRHTMCALPKAIGTKLSAWLWCEASLLHTDLPLQTPSKSPFLHFCTRPFPCPYHPKCHKNPISASNQPHNSIAIHSFSSHAHPSPPCAVSPLSHPQPSAPWPMINHTRSTPTSSSASRAIS